MKLYEIAKARTALLNAGTTFDRNQLRATLMSHLAKDVEYQVLMAPPHGMTNPVTLDVPVGLPRIINVATLKAMLGANSRDVAFRKAVDEERWAICSDN